MRTISMACMAAFAAASAAFAAETQVWFAAPSASGAIGYLASSIKHDPRLGTVALTSVTYLNAPGKTAKGAAFQYVVAQDSFDCIGRQTRPVARLLLDGKSAIVDQFDAEPNGPWSPIKDDPTLLLLQSVACQGKALAGAKQFNDFAAATKAMKTMK